MRSVNLSMVLVLLILVGAHSLATVETPYGEIIGSQTRLQKAVIYSFQGVPYAEPVSNNFKPAIKVRRYLFAPYSRWH